MQLQELNNCFNEVNTELLLCVRCLSPFNPFASFVNQKLNHLAEFYPKDFFGTKFLALSDQLENFIIGVWSNVEFSNLNGIGVVCQKMVETRKDIGYSLVFRLLTLVLVLPIVTATVERAFSAMKIVKNRLRDRMDDQWLHDSLIVYIEKEILDSITNEDAIISCISN